MAYIAPIIQGLTTLVLGLVAAYIAWRHWRTSQDRVVLDLFDRRFQVFQELTRAIAAAFHKPNVQVPDLANFDVATEKAQFLFGPEVSTVTRRAECTSARPTAWLGWSDSNFDVQRENSSL
jgi:hypothetical protein